jgi:hypothetical protein
MMTTVAEDELCRAKLRGATQLEATMKTAWWRVGATCTVAVAAYGVMVYRAARGSEDDAATTLDAAILFPPLIAMCLASLLSRNRPALVTTLLVGVIVLNVVCVGGMMGKVIDPIGLAGVWVMQWIAGVVVLLVSIIALVVGWMQGGGDTGRREGGPPEPACCWPWCYGSGRWSGVV